MIQSSWALLIGVIHSAILFLIGISLILFNLVKTHKIMSNANHSILISSHFNIIKISSIYSSLITQLLAILVFAFAHFIDIAYQQSPVYQQQAKICSTLTLQKLVQYIPNPKQTPSEQKYKHAQFKFKNKLNQAYAEESQSSIQNSLDIIKLQYYLAGIPFFLAELNSMGEIQLLAMLQILFMKSSHWKNWKDVIQKWVATLMKKVLAVAPQIQYQIKTQISALGYQPELQQNVISFYAEYLTKVSKIKSHESMIVSISFLRVLLIDELQNKKKQFWFAENCDNKQNMGEWKLLNEAVIKICGNLQNLKFEEICISIVYWLCSQSKEFILQSVNKGIINFLSQSLSNPDISEWYGRKILSFLKLIFMDLQNINDYFPFNDMQSCIAQFTMKFDNITIMQQARNLFTCFGKGEGKVTQQVSLYKAYSNQKNAKNLEKLVKNCRVLLLYSEDEVVQKQLNTPQSLDFLLKLIKKQDNLKFLTQVFNIAAYSTIQKNLEAGLIHQNLSQIIQKVSFILSDSKSKQQLSLNNKKILITLIRMLKQMIQNNDSPQMKQKLKSENMIKKLKQFSDCTNFRYQRQLLSLQRLLNTQKFNKSNQSSSVMKALVKHMNEQSRKLGKNLEDELQEIQLLYQMIQRGQIPNMKQQAISAIFQKIKMKRNQTEDVQITILDKSQQQRNRDLITRINYFAIASLEKLQKEYYHSTHYPIRTEDIDKLCYIGNTTEDMDLLKVDTGYLIVLSQHQKVDEKYQQAISKIYRKYKDKFGQDSQLTFTDKKIIQKEAELVQPQEQKKIKSIQEIFLDSFTGQITLQEEKTLENTLMNEQNIQQLKKWVQMFHEMKLQSLPNQSKLFLNFILKLSQKQELKSLIFDRFYHILSNQIESTNIENSNQIFRIFHELYDQTFHQNRQLYNELLNKSYLFLTKQSLQFTNTCLRDLQNKSSNLRHQQYWNYIYNSPDMISREALSFVSINYGKSKVEKFWSFFGKFISENVQQQKRLTLDFLQTIGTSTTKDIWLKFKLQSVLLKLLSCLRLRSQQLPSKPSLALYKKLLRLSKPILSITANENLQISTSAFTLYTQISQIIERHPKLDKNGSYYSQKLTQIDLEHIKVLLGILKSLFLRRECFNVIKGDLIKFQKVLAKIGEIGDGRFNGTLAEMLRIMLLRDDKHSQFDTISSMLNKYAEKISNDLSQIGNEHLKSCTRIVSHITLKNSGKFKKQYLQYFHPSQAKDLEQISFTDEQLLRHLKNLLNPPYQHGLNTLQKHLKTIENVQFSNVLIQIFNNSLKLFNEDEENRQKSLEDVQTKICDCIWGPGIHLGSQFYEMIKTNIIGLRVCLKTKSIGLTGTQIVCQKFYQAPQHIPLYAQILYINVTLSKQWSLVLERNIPTLINQVYAKNGSLQIYAKNLADVIGASSKLKGIQNVYAVQMELFDNLSIYEGNVECLASTLYALSGLVYLNDTNQKILGTQQCLKKYISLIKTNPNPLVFQKCCNLLSNLVYKNTSLSQMYLQLEIPSIVIQIACGMLYSYNCHKQFMRLIGNLSLLYEAAYVIVGGKFLAFWSTILKQAEQSKQQDMVKYCFDIIFNLLNYHEMQAKTLAHKVFHFGCGNKIIDYLNRNCLATSLVESGLDALEKLFIIEICRKQGIQCSVIKCLQSIAITQSWNENVLQKWIRVFYSLCQDNCNISIMLNSQIFGRLANFMKQHPQIKQQFLNVIISISDLVYQKGEHKLFVSCGFIDLLVEILKIKHVKSINAITIIDNFNTLHEQKILNSISYTKIFGGLMSRLEIEFRDENSKKIISSITKIRERIIINTRAATILLEFGYMFLTQSQIITSQKYQKRVRQFICLLSYFIAFNLELKLIFREQGFTEILHSWIKIDKSLDEDNSVSQACRVCIFSIQNEQRFLVNIGDHSSITDPYTQKLSNPVKCLLYRRNHTNKNAILKLRKTTNKCQLVSFKAPDGQIKQKYILPLDQLIGLHSYQSQQDPLFKQSVFSTPGGIFQKSANLSHCLSLVGIVGDGLSIRQIDVEFNSKEGKDEFVEGIRFVSSIEYRNHKTFM